MAMNGGTNSVPVNQRVSVGGLLPSCGQDSPAVGGTNATPAFGRNCRNHRSDVNGRDVRQRDTPATPDGWRPPSSRSVGRLPAASPKRKHVHICVAVECPSGRIASITDSRSTDSRQVRRVAPVLRTSGGICYETSSGLREPEEGTTHEYRAGPRIPRPQPNRRTRACDAAKRWIHECPVRHAVAEHATWPAANGQASEDVSQSSEIAVTKRTGRGCDDQPGSEVYEQTTLGCQLLGSMDPIASTSRRVLSLPADTAPKPRSRCFSATPDLIQPDQCCLGQNSLEMRHPALFH